MTTSHVILFYLIAILLSSLAVLRRSWYTSTLTDKEYAAFDFPVSVFCLPMLTVPSGNTKEVPFSLHLHLKFQPFSYTYFLSMNIFFHLNTLALNLIMCQCNCPVRMQGISSFLTGFCFSCDH